MSLFVHGQLNTFSTLPPNDLSRYVARVRLGRRFINFYECAANLSYVVVFIVCISYKLSISGMSGF